MDKFEIKRNRPMFKWDKSDEAGPCVHAIDIKHSIENGFHKTEWILPRVVETSTTTSDSDGWEEIDINIPICLDCILDKVEKLLA